MCNDCCIIITTFLSLLSSCCCCYFKHLTRTSKHLPPPPAPATSHSMPHAINRLQTSLFAIIITILLLLINDSFIQNTLVSQVSAASHYIGCFQDVIQLPQRALPLGFLDSQLMTNELCIDKCTEHGLPFAGLQYTSECWCGKKFPPYPLLNDASCSSTCGGDKSQSCGGPLTLSVFQADEYPNQELKPAQHIQDQVASRPLLALVMMVKDEKHTILNTIASVKSVIDAWYVLDTGSTDGTQDTIKRELSHLPGGILEQPFVDYGTSRNAALNFANSSNPRPIFALMLSADETIQNPQDLKKHCQDNIYTFGKQSEAFPVIMNTGIFFDSIRLSRMESNWRYVGKVHEYLAAPGGQFWELQRPKPDIRVNFQPTDSDRRFKSQYKIAEILEGEVRAKYNDTRSLFYLARTYTILSNYSGAYAMYDQLQQVSTWDEEQYEALFCMGEMSQSMNQAWETTHHLFLRAYALIPTKVDAIFFLAQHYYHAGQQYWNLAKIYAKEASQLPIPANLQQVQNVLMRESKSIYETKASELLIEISKLQKDWKNCIRGAKQILQYNHLNSVALANQQECQRQLIALNPQSSHSITGTESLSFELEEEYPFLVPVIRQSDSTSTLPSLASSFKSLITTKNVSNPDLVSHAGFSWLTILVLLALFACLLLVIAAFYKQTKNKNKKTSFLGNKLI